MADQAHQLHRPLHRKGGTTDMLGAARHGQGKSGRRWAPRLSWRCRAGGTTATDYTVKANPDGYTIQGGTVSTHAINPSLYPKLPHDPVKQFQPLTLGSVDAECLGSADSPFKPVQDVVAGVRRKAGRLELRVVGNGTTQHLSACSGKSSWPAPLMVACLPRAAPSRSLRPQRAGPDLIFRELRAGAAHPGRQTARWRHLGQAVRRPCRISPAIARETLPGFEVVSAGDCPAGVQLVAADRLATELMKAVNHP